MAWFATLTAALLALGACNLGRNDAGPLIQLLGPASGSGNAPLTWITATRSEHHTLAIRSDGTLWAWGANTAGELGLGDTTDRHFPTQVGTDTDWVQVAAGDCCSTPGISAALKSDGTVWAWGANYDGTLGDGTFDAVPTAPHPLPAQVPGLSNVTAITGGTTLVALLADGSLWAWGRSNVGQTGLGAPGPDDCSPNALCSWIPRQINPGSTWQTVWSTGFVAFAIAADGTAWVWGFNAGGELGLGNTVEQDAPVALAPPGATPWVAGSTNNVFLGIASDGTLWTAGQGADGEMANGTQSSSLPLLQVATITDWSEAQAGGSHAMAIEQGGLLWTWGSNAHGELGYPTTEVCPSGIVAGEFCSSVPAPLADPGPWQHLVRGNTALVSGAIKQDGTLWMWGQNDRGQTGNGTVGDTGSPVMIPVQ